MLIDSFTKRNETDLVCPSHASQGVTVCDCQTQANRDAFEKAVAFENILTGIEGQIAMVTRTGLVNYAKANPKHAQENLDRMRVILRTLRHIAVNG